MISLCSRKTLLFVFFFFFIIFSRERKWVADYLVLEDIYVKSSMNIAMLVHFLFVAIWKPIIFLMKRKEPISNSNRRSMHFKIVILISEQFFNRLRRGPHITIYETWNVILFN